MLFDPGKPRNGHPTQEPEPVYPPVSDTPGGCAIIRRCNNARQPVHLWPRPLRDSSKTPPISSPRPFKGYGLARPRSAPRGLLGRDARVELLHGGGVAARDAFPRHPASARTGPGRHAAQRPAFGRLLGDLLRSAERRHQQHRRMLRGAALRRHEPRFAAARERASWILEHGGLSQVRVFTKYWLALLGEWPWSATPNLPPEVIATPRWYPFNIYNFASWARTTLMPLAVLSARRAVRPLPPDRRLDELFPGGRDKMDYRLPRRGSCSRGGGSSCCLIACCTSIKRSASRRAARSRSTRA